MQNNPNYQQPSQQPCPRPARIEMKAAALIAFAVAWFLAFMGLQPLAGVAVLASFVLMCFI